MYKESYNLNGKTAFITGGGRGIGLCSADALAEAGANYRKAIADRLSNFDGSSLTRHLLSD